MGTLIYVGDNSFFIITARMPIQKLQHQHASLLDYSYHHVILLYNTAPQNHVCVTARSMLLLISIVFGLYKPPYAPDWGRDIHV